MKRKRIKMYKDEILKNNGTFEAIGKALNEFLLETRELLIDNGHLFESIIKEQHQRWASLAVQVNRELRKMKREEGVNPNALKIFLEDHGPLIKGILVEYDDFSVYSPD